MWLCRWRRPSGVTVFGNLVAGVVAARVQGFRAQEAANIGLSVLARGEFSLILASLAVVAGLDDRLGPFAAAYVLVLAVAGPLAVSRSHVLARGSPRRLFAEGSFGGREPAATRPTRTHRRSDSMTPRTRTEHRSTPLRSPHQAVGLSFGAAVLAVSSSPRRWRRPRSSPASPSTTRPRSTSTSTSLRVGMAGGSNWSRWPGRTRGSWRRSPTPARRGCSASPMPASTGASSPCPVRSCGRAGGSSRSPRRSRERLSAAGFEASAAAESPRTGAGCQPGLDTQFAFRRRIGGGRPGCRPPHMGRGTAGRRSPATSAAPRSRPGWWRRPPGRPPRRGRAHQQGPVDPVGDGVGPAGEVEADGGGQHGHRQQARHPGHGVVHARGRRPCGGRRPRPGRRRSGGRR